MAAKDASSAVTSFLRTAQATRTVDSTTEARASLTPELVIALCGPIGSPLHHAGIQMGNELRGYGYRVETIRLSNVISMNASVVGKKIAADSRIHQIRSLIDAGDALREKFGNDVLAKVAIAKISGDRKSLYGQFSDAVGGSDSFVGTMSSQQRVCHVIDSIKNKFELELLRLIYGDALFAVGVFSPLETRTINLKSAGAVALNDDEIKQLIDTDSGEEFSHGQSVRDTFPRCDFFLRVDEPVFGSTESQAIGQIASKASRLISLIFRTKVVTPTPEETAMYASASAARNSACLSRQVGAAVTSSSGELLSVGWNDVPQAGGGLYGKPTLRDHREVAQALDDKRCYNLVGTICFNDDEKKGIARMIAQILVDKKMVAKKNLAGTIEAITSDTRVKDLIEFSRAVHAEMHAILGASRVAGERVVGGKMFVTTYPCHSCARHIVASGISEVHYIEPYRKSMATKLHKDALTESVSETNKVRLIQFDGVAPRRFIDMFESGDRKKSGVLNLPNQLEARPATSVSLKAIPRLEQVVIAEVTSKNLNLPALTPIEQQVQHDKES